jgi:hypothetical protein
VDGKKRQHVVKKGDPRIEFRPAGSIKQNLGGNLSFFGGPFQSANSLYSHKRSCLFESRQYEHTIHSNPENSIHL